LAVERSAKGETMWSVRLVGLAAERKGGQKKKVKWELPTINDEGKGDLPSLQTWKEKI